MSKRDGTSKRHGGVEMPKEHQVAVVRWKMTEGGVGLYERFFLRPTSAHRFAQKQLARGAVEVAVYVGQVATWTEGTHGQS